MLFAFKPRVDWENWYHSAVNMKLKPAVNKLSLAQHNDWFNHKFKTSWDTTECILNIKNYPECDHLQTNSVFRQQFYKVFPCSKYPLVLLSPYESVYLWNIPNRWLWVIYDLPCLSLLLSQLVWNVLHQIQNKQIFTKKLIWHVN